MIARFFFDKNGGGAKDKKPETFLFFSRMSLHFTWDVIFYRTLRSSECNSVGRVSRCQRDCRRFESVHSLHFRPESAVRFGFFRIPTDSLGVNLRVSRHELQWIPLSVKRQSAYGQNVTDFPVTCSGRPNIYPADKRLHPRKFRERGKKKKPVIIV